VFFVNDFSELMEDNDFCGFESICDVKINENTEGVVMKKLL